MPPSLADLGVASTLVPHMIYSDSASTVYQYKPVTGTTGRILLRGKIAEIQSRGVLTNDQALYTVFLEPWDILDAAVHATQVQVLDDVIQTETHAFYQSSAVVDQWTTCTPSAPSGRGKVCHIIGHKYIAVQVTDLPQCPKFI
ncbi:hypothetical protein DFH09DRAFT_1311172 [Mycena vulgaris]|nr:hypothetical protein DFH09DRAFT_1311172 [Mycena vulgaris]